MPKRVFWPATILIIGLISLAAYMGLMPDEFMVMWLLIPIIVGLGGLVVSDREEWLVEPGEAKKKSSSKKKKSSSKKSSKKSTTKKKKSSRSKKSKK